MVRKANESDESKSDDAGTNDAEASVRSAMEDEAERGYRGTKVDGTPDHAYTVAGVVAGEDVPEAAADPTAARAEAAKQK